MLQQSIQTIACAVFVLFASPIAGAITPQWWYGLGACLSAASFIIVFFFVPETKYYRPLSSYQEGLVTNDADVPGDEPIAKRAFDVCTERPALDFDNYEARSWGSDLRLWIGKPEWRKGLDTFVVCPSLQAALPTRRCKVLTTLSNLFNFYFSPMFFGLWL